MLRGAREHEMFGNELLADFWESSNDSGGFLFANALENWTDIDWVASEYINRKLYRGTSDLDERVEACLREDPVQGFVAEVKEKEGMAYCDELKQLKKENMAKEQVHVLE